MTTTVWTRDDLRLEVEQELRELLARSESAAESYGPEFARLWALASNHVGRGKLVRPLLLLETYDALRAASAPSPIRSETVRIAAAIEVLHYSFLLHDDVIDGDLFRRGRLNLIGELGEASPCVSRPGDGRHWAQTGGILAGDLMLSCAHQLFARADLPVEQRIRLLDLLEHTVFETTAGEFVDVGLSDGLIGPDLATVLAMTGRKTATYSFELPLRAAAILAGASLELEQRLREAGWYLGLAYQLQDDLLSTFGDAEVHGKDAFSDLREGKQTAIVCFARLCGEWSGIETELSEAAYSIAAVQSVRRRLRACGAEAFVQNLVSDQMTAFRNLLANESEIIPDGVQRVLLALQARLDGRAS